MATTLTIVFMGALAMLLNVGQVLGTDTMTRSLLGWISAVVWGLMGLSAFSVHAQAYTGSRPNMVLVTLGLGFAVLTALLALKHTSDLIGQTSGATEARKAFGGGRR